MIRSLFSVQDAKAGFFYPASPAANAAIALRDFADGVRNPESVMHKHPEDFVLYEVGSYDDQTGFFTNLTVPKMLGTATQFLDSK